MTYTIANTNAEELNQYGEFVPYTFSQDGDDATLTVNAADETYIESIFAIYNITYSKE